jgi:hypothetical protein
MPSAEPFRISGVFEVYNIAMRSAVYALVGITKFLRHRNQSAPESLSVSSLPIG